jgi:hypothetical protein
MCGITLSVGLAIAGFIPCMVCSPDKLVVVERVSDTSSFNLCIDVQTAASLWPHGAQIAFVDKDPFLLTFRLVVVSLSPSGISWLKSKEIGPAFFPSFSPDGKRIAYSTGTWGNTNSRVFTCNSSRPDSMTQVIPGDAAFAPTWWINPRSKDTCIVYTNSVVLDIDSGWELTKTFMHRMNGTPQQGDSVICPRGSFYGGLSEDGQFLATGYTRLKVYDTKHDSLFTLFKFPQNGKDSNGSEQICNFSLSSAPGGVCKGLFVDFGCETTSRITGGSYSYHEYIFVCAIPGGQVERCFHFPAGENIWQYSKWSNSQNYAICCTTDSLQSPHAVYAIGIRDSTFHKISEMKNGHVPVQPALWIRE